jgi:hypothetical protein
MQHQGKFAVVVTTLVFFSVSLFSADVQIRSFSNGFALRTAGNVFTVQTGSFEQAASLDKSVDGGNGPYKGDVIGLTRTEKEKGVQTIIHKD